MPQPIPSYLLAIGIGELEARTLGARTGVYAEPKRIEAAAYELADTEKMVAAAESLYGPYRWGRYDMLVLPPSFPIGGMENPRLTFLTPTMIAGDRSLVDLIAHELAHSWSGNLVTNASWKHWWLNEGFTTYVTTRILEVLYGDEVATMNLQLEQEEAIESLKDEPKPSRRCSRATRIPARHLHRRRPGLSERRLAAAHPGAARRPRRVRSLPARLVRQHAFQSVTTEQFVAYLRNQPAGPNTRT
jgi:leukotriene-A4 hydrolase